MRITIADETPNLLRHGRTVDLIDETQSWYQYNKLHRVGGPAEIWDDVGHKLWFHIDKLHRINGPAIEYSNGRKEWWIEGLRVQ